MLVHPFPLPAWGTRRQRAHRHAAPRSPARDAPGGAGAHQLPGLDAPNQDTKHRNKTGGRKGKKERGGKNMSGRSQTLGRRAPGRILQLPQGRTCLRGVASCVTSLVLPTGAPRSFGSLERLGIHPGPSGARTQRDQKQAPGKKTPSFPRHGERAAAGRIAARPGEVRRARSLFAFGSQIRRGA